MCIAAVQDLPDNEKKFDQLDGIARTARSAFGEAQAAKAAAAKLGRAAKREAEGNLLLLWEQLNRLAWVGLLNGVEGTKLKNTYEELQVRYARAVDENPATWVVGLQPVAIDSRKQLFLFPLAIDKVLNDAVDVGQVTQTLKGNANDAKEEIKQLKNPKIKEDYQGATGGD